MKKTLKILLAVVATACLLNCIFGQPAKISFTLFAFPFEQIGIGLRLLSTSSTLGNAVSILIYFAICLLPIAYFIFRSVKKCLNPEDGLLILMSMMLLAVIYQMINPIYIAQHFGHGQFVNEIKSFLGLTLYSIIAGYFILHALRIFKTSKTNSIIKALKVLLSFTCILFVFSIFGIELGKLISSFKNLSPTNSFEGMYVDTFMNPLPMQSISFNHVFLSFQYLITILPSALGIVAIFSVIDLINSLENDPYGQSLIISAQKTGRICQYSISTIILSQICINVLQFIFGSMIASSNYTFSIPFIPVMILLTIMLLSSYFEKAKQLKDDNDMFI